MPPAIVIQDLTRSYQSYRKPEGILHSLRGFWHREYDEKVALRPTNLQIGEGEIVGLVGANGAGKTTLLKMLSGLIHPTGGSAQVLGFKPYERQSSFLRQISILLGQKSQLWWDIPATDSFRLLTDIYDLDTAVVRTRVEDLAERLGCRHLLQVQIRRLSLGERMKMEIIGSLLHRPKVLFLDEPTLGLDILAQAAIRQFLQEYADLEKPTIILTSHYMDDIAKLAQRLLLISQGSLVYDGTVENFVSAAEPEQNIFLRLTDPLKEEVELFDGLKLARGTKNWSAEIPAKKTAELLRIVMRHGNIEDLKIAETDFEKVIHEFLQLESQKAPASGRPVHVP